jgi:hypothetical protein
MKASPGGCCSCRFARAFFAAGIAIIHCFLGRSTMIHFTCDRCKRVIDSEQELRYIVRMEIEAVMDPIHEDEPQDDRDHLHEIEEILERLDAGDSDEIGVDIYHKRRYDLCPTCFHKFSANPLAREKKSVFGFSHN